MPEIEAETVWDQLRDLSRGERAAVLAKMSPEERRAVERVAPAYMLGLHRSKDQPRGTFLDGDVLKERRQARGLTQPELAELLGVSERSVRGWEHGQQSSRDTSTIARQLAAILGGEPADYREKVPKDA